MSKPMSAMVAMRLANPVKPPSERGKTSYQAPQRPLGRSTHRGKGSAAVTLPGRGVSCTAAATASSRPALRRTSTLHADRLRAAAASTTRARRTSGTSWVRASSRRAPSSSSRSTSWPAAALRVTS